MTLKLAPIRRVTQPVLLARVFERSTLGGALFGFVLASVACGEPDPSDTAAPDSGVVEECESDLDGTQCSENEVFVLACDSCDEIVECGQVVSGDPQQYHWYQIGLPCDCLADDGTLIDDPDCYPAI